MGTSQSGVPGELRKVGRLRESKSALDNPADLAGQLAQARPLRPPGGDC